MTDHGEQRLRLRVEPFLVFFLSFSLLFLSLTSSSADVPIESIGRVETRSLVGEVATPGCSLVYAIGQRRFATLCANGGLLIIGLDEAGAVTQRIPSEPSGRGHSRRTWTRRSHSQSSTASLLAPLGILPISKKMDSHSFAITAPQA